MQALFPMARLASLAWVLAAAFSLFGHPALAEEILIQDISLDKPLVLDQDADYVLRNVSVTGLTDTAALTLSGRISSVLIENSSFGRVWSGMEGKAAGIECAGALVKTLIARKTTFFDSEHYLATLKDGSFGRVTFEGCRFSTSEMFLKQVYLNNPWRTTPPVTEFYNIERLELLDNEYSNTMLVIHPSVKQVIVRGAMPGLKVENPQSTQLIRLEPGQKVDMVPMPGSVATAARAAIKG